MGDNDEGFRGVRNYGEQEFHNELSVVGVEVSGGFVGEDDVGVVCEGAGDGDALLFASGEFGRQVVEAVGEADFFE